MSIPDPPRSGDRITARFLNDLTHESAEIAGDAFGVKTSSFGGQAGARIDDKELVKKFRRRTKKGTGVSMFRVLEVRSDYILCERLTGGDNGNGNGGEEPTLVRVAKPYLLRRSPFDGKTLGPFKYEYDGDEAGIAGVNSAQWRPAINRAVELLPSGANHTFPYLELHTIVPWYTGPIEDEGVEYEGDILAAIAVQQDIMIYEDEEDEWDPESEGWEDPHPIRVPFLDLNTDGRTWAEDASGRIFIEDEGS